MKARGIGNHREAYPALVSCLAHVVWCLVCMLNQSANVAAPWRYETISVVVDESYRGISRARKSHPMMRKKDKPVNAENRKRDRNGALVLTTTRRSLVIRGIARNPGYCPRSI